MSTSATPLLGLPRTLEEGKRAWSVSSGERRHIRRAGGGLPHLRVHPRRGNDNNNDNGNGGLPYVLRGDGPSFIIVVASAGRRCRRLLVSLRLSYNSRAGETRNETPVS